MRYIGDNFHHSHLRPGKKEIINSEAQQNDKQYLPQLFQRNGTRIVETSLQEQSNANKEREGASFAHIVRQHKHNIVFLFLMTLIPSSTHYLQEQQEREKTKKSRQSGGLK